METTVLGLGALGTLGAPVWTDLAGPKWETYKWRYCLMSDPEVGLPACMLSRILR